MARLGNYNTNVRYQAKVLSSERLTPPDTEEIREIQIEVQDPEFNCQVDQSFGVLVAANEDFGNEWHHRLYSVADLPEKKGKNTRIMFLVKRCSYIDEFSGEIYPGIASNYLCDLMPEDKLMITGPFELPFTIPEDPSANLIFIGMGTGIAPFRAFIKHIYHQEKKWKGSIQLYYGARSGLELLYMNDEAGDLTNYYDEETFEAFHALSPRPDWDDPIALEATIVGRAEKVLEALAQSNTYIYVAGHLKVRKQLDDAFAEILGSLDQWTRRKAELIAGHKWAEIIY